MNEIYLNFSELKVFTEQDALDYCSINNINTDNIIELYLDNNDLIDISGIRLFKNLEHLDIGYNNIFNISVLKDLKNIKRLILFNNININNISSIQYLNNLEELDITNLRLESDQIKYINSLKKLKELYSSKGFKDMKILKQLNKNIKLYK